MEFYKSNTFFGGVILAIGADSDYLSLLLHVFSWAELNRREDGESP